MFYKNIEAIKSRFCCTMQYHTYWFVKSFVIILHFFRLYIESGVFSFLYFFIYLYDVHILNGGEPDIPGVLQRACITPTNRRTAEDLAY